MGLNSTLNVESQESELNATCVNLTSLEPAYSCEKPGSTTEWLRRDTNQLRGTLPTSASTGSTVSSDFLPLVWDKVRTEQEVGWFGSPLHKSSPQGLQDRSVLS